VGVVDHEFVMEHYVATDIGRRYVSHMLTTSFALLSMGLQHFLALDLALCCGTFHFIDTTVPFGLTCFHGGGTSWFGGNTSFFST
jgi:hypothetical protein